MMDSAEADRERQRHIFLLADGFDKLLEELVADYRVAHGALILSLARSLGRSTRNAGDLQVATCHMAALLGHQAFMEFLSAEHKRRSGDGPTKPPPGPV